MKTSVWARRALILFLSLLCATNFVIARERSLRLRYTCVAVCSLVGSEVPRHAVGFARGSGFFVGPHHILTCSHLLRVPSPHGLLAAETVIIEFVNGRQHPAEIVATDSEHDLALLRVSEKVSGAPAELRHFDLVRGDEVRIAGLFDPSGFWVTNGRITAFNVLDGFAMADAKVRSGYSGGPVFATNGEVVGMLSQRDEARHAIFVRSDVILAFLEAYEQYSGERVNRRSLSQPPKSAPFLRLGDNKSSSPRAEASKAAVHSKSRQGSVSKSQAQRSSSPREPLPPRLRTFGSK